MNELERKKQPYKNAVADLDYGRAVTIDSYVGELEHRIKHYHNLLESLSKTRNIPAKIMKEQPDKKIIDANDLLQYILRKINDELERGTE